MKQQVKQFGALLREWRQLRGMSQLQLATSAEVSQRHVSFLETGRSHPSREMVVHLARILRIEPRELNDLLVAAGFAPNYSESPMRDLAEVGAAVDFMLQAHEPNMAIAVDRHWKIISSNSASLNFMAATVKDPPLFDGNLNALVLLFHPKGFRNSITNFSEIAPTLLWRLDEDIDRAPTDHKLRELQAELTNLAGPLISPTAVPMNAGLVTTIHFDFGGKTFHLFSCLAALESPKDLTVAELRVETFFPADELSRQAWNQVCLSNHEE